MIHSVSMWYITQNGIQLLFHINEWIFEITSSCCYRKIHFWNSFWNGKSLSKKIEKDEANRNNGEDSSTICRMDHSHNNHHYISYHVHHPLFLYPCWSRLRINRAEVIRWWWQSTTRISWQKTMTSILWRKDCMQR